MTLQALFDGWTNFMVPDEDFVVPANLSPVFPEPEDEELAFGESETPEPEWRILNNWSDPERLPGQHTEMAWATVSLALGSLCEVVGGKKNSYQENVWSEDRKSILERRFVFQYKPGDTGFREGRL